MKTIEQLHNEILTSSIFRRSGAKIDLCAKLMDLCKAINSREDEDDDGSIWNIGEFSEASLDSLLIGAYWSLTEWHGGQASEEYAALCSIGSIFSPGMSSPPDEDAPEFTAYELIGKHFEQGNH